MNVLTDKKNILLKRREVKLVIESDSNPGFEKSTELVANHFKSNAENVALKNVKSKFGRNTFLIDAYIYDTKEDKMNTEPKPKEKKGGSS